jgi:hypothetical protein
MRPIIGRGYGALVPPAAGGRRSILTEPIGCGLVQYPRRTDSQPWRAAVARLPSGTVTDELEWRIRAADGNFVASFGKLIGMHPGSELERIGTAVALDTRIPGRIFNGVAVLEPVETDDLRAAVACNIRVRSGPGNVHNIQM